MKISDRFKLLISSGFGLGLIPFAPGTFGTLIGVFLVWDANTNIRNSPQYSVLFYFTCVLFISLQLAPWAMKYWKSNNPKQFILNDVLGYLLTILIIGNSLDKYNPPLYKVLIISFLLFRFCDIIKLPGAKYIDENLHNKIGLGIILNDLISAIYAGGSLRIAMLFIK